MLIIKSSSDSRLVDSLCVIGQDGKSVKGVKQLDTETLRATLNNDSVVTVLDFWFFVSFSDLDSVLALLPQELHSKVGPGSKSAHEGPHKQSMVVEANTEFFTSVEAVHPFVFRCSACGAQFLLFRTDTSVYSAKLASTSATFHELTEVNVAAVTCDHCATTVAIIL